MKYLRWVYLVLIGGIILIWVIYFEKGSKRGSDYKSNTEIVITNKIINKGISKYNNPVEGIFEITNIGNEPLIITNVKTDCNCTVPNWEHDVILPKRKTIIKLVFNGTSLGYYQKKAMVSCNIDNSPILLILRGRTID